MIKNGKSEGTHKHPHHNQANDCDKITADILVYDTVIYRRRPRHKNTDINRKHRHLRNNVHCLRCVLGSNTHKVCKKQKEHGQKNVDSIGLCSFLAIHQALSLHRTIDCKHQALRYYVRHRKPLKPTGQKLLNKPDNDITEHGAQEQNCMTTGFNFSLCNRIQSNTYHRQHIADKIYVVQKVEWAIFTHQFGCTVYKLDINAAVIYRQNSGACGNCKHHKSEHRQRKRDTFPTFDFTKAKNHHQKEKRQKHTAKIGNTIGIQSV